MKTIAIIPARGGSKSIPKKNIRLFNGKPLLYWSAKACQEADFIHQVIVATDSKEIENVSKSFGFNKLQTYSRSKASSTDTASTEQVLIEFIERNKIGHDTRIILIQATSPFISSKNLEGANHLMMQYDSVLSCVKIKRFFWTNDAKPINYNTYNRPRRQDFEGVFLENGAIYINSAKNILKDNNRLSGKIGIYEMPSYTEVEIDEDDDWIVAETLHKKYCLKQEKIAANVKLFVSDVDGVLTDGGMYYSEYGDELKKFNTKDGMALQLLREKGVKTALITSEKTKLLEKRAKKMKVDYLKQKKYGKGKLHSIEAICKKEGFSLENVLYVGDDINCFESLTNVGFPFCPLDAIDSIKQISNIRITDAIGGSGVLREIYQKYFTSKQTDAHQ